MTTLYAVVCYVPDVFADERINIGVMVWGDGRVRSQFVRDWRRVERFGQRDVAYLREFAEWVTSEGGPLLPIDGATRFGEDTVGRIAGRWGGSIQVSEPKPSMRSVDDTLRAVASRLLRDPKPSQMSRDDREAAVREATQRIRSSVETTLGREALEHVRAECDVPGVVGAHRFDVVVSNDNETPLGIVRAMSFRVERAEALRQQVDALAWAAQDVRARVQQARIVAYVIPPLGASDAFEHACRTMHHLHIALRDAQTFSPWVDAVVRDLAESAPRSALAR